MDGVWGYAISTLLGGATLGTPIAYWQTIRVEKRAKRAEDRADQAEQRAGVTGEVDAVSKLLATNLEVQQRLTDAFDQIRAARSEAADATATATRAQLVADDVRAKFYRLVVAFRPIVRWMDDGAVGDPPHVSDDVRRLLDETDR